MLVSEIKIFHRVEIAKAEIVGEPLKNVRVMDISETNAQEKVDAYVYDVTTIRQALIPAKRGEIELPPFRLRLSLVQPAPRQRRIDDFFDDFFNSARGRIVQKVVASRKDVLNIKALPEEGKPENFKGIVGEFTLTHSLSSRSLKVGDTTTLTLPLSRD